MRHVLGMAADTARSKYRILGLTPALYGALKFYRPRLYDAQTPRGTAWANRRPWPMVDRRGEDLPCLVEAAAGVEHALS